MQIIYTLTKTNMQYVAHFSVPLDHVSVSRPRRPRRSREEIAPASGAVAVAARKVRVNRFLERPIPDAAALGVSVEVADLLARAAEVNARSITHETRLSYAHRWTDYERWCEAAGIEPLPTSPDSLILYLQSLVDQPGPFSISTARGRVAAISRVNVEAGFPSPSRSPAVSIYMRALARTLGRGTRHRRVRALKTEDLRQASSVLPDIDARAVRDRAIIALHAIGLPPEEIASLRQEDVVIKRSGMWIRARTGADARQVTDRVDLPARSALSAWLAIAHGGPTQLFTTTDQHGTRSHAKVAKSDIARTIQRRLAGMGLSDEDPSGLATAVRLLNRPNGLSLRDRALLLVGFSAAMRRVDLTLLRWGDVTDDPEGVLIYLAYSKTDRNGHGKTIAIPYGRNPRTCPVTALFAWRDYVAQQIPPAQLPDQHIFVPVGRSGRLGSERMCSSAVTGVIVRRAAEAGLDGPWGGRSLRAGLITTAIELGIPLEEIARQTRHASIENLLLYWRQDNPFAQNPAGKVGL